MKFKTMLVFAILFYISVYFTAKFLQALKIITPGKWGVH